MTKEATHTLGPTFTLGPWNVWHDTPTSVGAGWRLICSTDGCEDSRRDSGELVAENEANARLIAASPELYEALEKANRLLDMYIQTHGEMAIYSSDNTSIVAAKEWGSNRRLLAKARGEGQS